MSSRIYNLRVRTGAVEEPQDSQDVEVLPSEPYDTSPNMANPLNVAEPPSEVPVLDSEPTVAIRMYSDVVASRPPSPSRERPMSPSESPAMGPNSTRVSHRPYDEKHAVDSGNHRTSSD